MIEADMPELEHCYVGVVDLAHAHWPWQVDLLPDLQMAASVADLARMPPWLAYLARTLLQP